MSFINDLLKELEKRERKTIILPHGIFAAQKPNYFFKVWLIGFILLSIAWIFLLLKPEFKPSTLKLAPILSDNNRQQNPLPLPDLTWLKPVTLKDISFQLKDRIVELTLLLDHASLYRLAADSTTNRLILTLEHAQLATTLPTFEYLHTAINQVAIKQRDDNIEINLFLKPDTKLQLVNFDSTNPTALTLAFANLAKTTTMEQPQSIIKTPALHDLLAEHYQLALKTAANGDNNLAINRLNSLLVTDPSYHDARVSLIALLLDQGKLKEAQQILDQGFKIKSDYLPFIELKARMLSNHGQLQDALNLLLNYTPPIYTNPEYHSLIAALYERTNQDQLAATLYKRLLALRPQNSHWWFGLGITLEKMGMNLEAKGAYTRALMLGRLSPDSIIFAQRRLKFMEVSHHASR